MLVCGINIHMITHAQHILKVTSRIVLNITNINEPPEIYMIQNSEIKEETFFIHFPENNEIGKNNYVVFKLTENY